MADIQLPLLGNTTLVLVGNSDEPATVITKTLSNLGGYTLTITSATPHDMRPNRGHFARYGELRLQDINSGTFVFDDFYGIATINFPLYAFTDDYFFQVDFIVKNSLFKNAATSGIWNGFNMCLQPGNWQAGAYLRNKISNCKFWGHNPLFLSHIANSSLQVQDQIENVVAYATSGQAAIDSSQEGWQTGFPHHFMAGSVVRNVLALVSNPGTMSAWKRAANPPYISEYGAITSYCARNGGIDDASFFLYPSVATVDAVISTNEADDGFLELKHQAPLWQGGGSTVIATNPYSSAPYPIGIWHMLPVVTSFSSTTATTGPAPLTVEFIDSSTEMPTSWLWDFGDGDVSTEQNPTHTYLEDGAYTVTLTATNSMGSDTEIRANLIVSLPIIGALKIVKNSTLMIDELRIYNGTKDLTEYSEFLRSLLN